MRISLVDNRLPCMKNPRRLINLHLMFRVSTVMVQLLVLAHFFLVLVGVVVQLVDIARRVQF